VHGRAHGEVVQALQAVIAYSQGFMDGVVEEIADASTTDAGRLGF
jgi:hypothetical protein